MIRALAVLLALLAGMGEARADAFTSTPPFSGGTVPGATTFGNAALGTGPIVTITNGIASHTISGNPTVGETGELVWANNAPGQNVLRFQNNASTGFSVFTMSGVDPWYTDNTTNFEHMAIGWGNAGLGYDFIEISAYDVASNPLIPPPAFQIQQTGGADGTGGTTVICATSATSTAMTCVGNGGANGTLVTAPGLSMPSVTGIQAATVVSSGGGTTSIVLSKPATVTNAALTVNFSSPTYAQRAVMQFERGPTGGIDMYNWDGSVNTYWDRVNKRLGIGTVAPAATLDVNGGARLNGNLNFVGAATIGTGSGQLTFTAGNHVVANQDTVAAGIVSTMTKNLQTGNGGQAIYNWATGTANSSMSFALLEQASASIGLFQVGSYVNNVLMRVPEIQFQTTSGTNAFEVLPQATGADFLIVENGTTGGILTNNGGDIIVTPASGVISTSGRLAFTGSSPVVSGCGTSPAIDSHATNNSGTVTVGTVAAASCTVTFANSGFTTWNHCNVTPQTALATFGYSYTKTVLTVTATSLLNEVFDYRCDGS